jgi:hypothetical protein
MGARFGFVCCMHLCCVVGFYSIIFCSSPKFFSLATFPWPLDRVVLPFISLIHVVAWFLHPCVAESSSPKKVIGLRIRFRRGFIPALYFHYFIGQTWT